MAAGARTGSKVDESAVAKQLCTTLPDREFHEIPALSAKARYPSRAKDRSEHDSEERRRLKKRYKLDDASEYSLSSSNPLAPPTLFLPV